MQIGEKYLCAGAPRISFRMRAAILRALSERRARGLRQIPIETTESWSGGNVDGASDPKRRDQARLGEKSLRLDFDCQSPVLV